MLAVAKVDLRVGGNYRIGMRSPEGRLGCAIGTLGEAQSPEKLVYTWSWAGTGDLPLHTRKPPDRPLPDRCPLE